jgi:hypothetical protein
MWSREVRVGGERRGIVHTSFCMSANTFVTASCTYGTYCQLWRPRRSRLNKAGPHLNAARLLCPRPSTQIHLSHTSHISYCSAPARRRTRTTFDPFTFSLMV